MKKILYVMRQELITTFQRPTYMILAFVVPVAVVLIFSAVKFFQNRNESSGTSNESPSEVFMTEAEGFIDESGLIQVLPSDIHPDRLVRFDDEAQAKAALKEGRISAYYIIPADYIEQGEIFYVYPENKPLISDGQDWVMSWTLALNLMNGNAEAANLAWNPIWWLEETTLAPASTETAVSGEDCSRPGAACQSNELVRMIPTILGIVFYISFLSSSNMLFASIGTEKENRTLEVLLQAIHPRQLLAGKILALGIAGLLQTVLWLGASYILFSTGGETLSLPAFFSFPKDILFWGLVFFIGGYFQYASLMAGAGALVPRMKESGVANFVAMMPLFIAYVVGLIAPIAGKAEAALPVILSFFPLTSPIMMITRLTNGIVPLWQVAISAVLTYVSGYFILRGATSIFQAHNLLSGQPFSLKRYVTIMLGAK